MTALAEGAVSRAGTLRTRLTFGSLLVAGVVLVVWIDSALAPVWATGAVIAALALTAQYEFYAMVRRGGFPVAMRFGLLAGAYFLATRFLPALGLGTAGGAYDAGAHLAVVTVAILVRGVLRRRVGDAPVEVATTLLGVVAVPFLLGYAIELRVSSDRGLGLLVFLVALAKTCDSCAYFGGVVLGRRRLIPEVSPKKTRVGAVCGFAGCVGLAAFLGAKDLAGGLGLTEAIGAGILIGVAAQFADLAESLLKRGCGVKDSASTIPVLGGAFDLVDSLLFAAPALRLYVSALGALGPE